MATDGKTFMDDQESLRALVACIPEPEQSEYRSYGSLALESCFPGRKMVVYTLEGGKPTDILLISFAHFMCDSKLGPNVEATYDSTCVYLSTVPTRLPGRDVFLHLPQKFELKYRGRQTSGPDVDFASHYAILIKTRSKEIHQVDGDTYFVTMNQFRARFPDLKIRY